MTAKEQANQALVKCSNHSITRFEPFYHFTQDEFKAFCEQLCNEQKYECRVVASNYVHELYGEKPKQKIQDMVRNAPSPEIT